MRKGFFYIVFVWALLATSCMSTRSIGSGGEVTGIGGTAYTEPTPYGMVLIERGSMKIGPAENDSIWGIKKDDRGISVDAFWMDETEITNSKYKQFILWVRDSIIRERLADPAYGGNEVFKIEEDKGILQRHVSRKSPADEGIGSIDRNADSEDPQDDPARPGRTFA